METIGQEDLYQRLEAADESVLEDLLRAAGPVIMMVLRKRFGVVLKEPDFEDVLSVGLYRLWVNRLVFDPARASLSVWLCRICENVARDVLRLGWHKARALEVHDVHMVAETVAAGRTRSSLLTRSGHSGAVESTDHEPGQVHMDLREIIADLPDAQRQILLADAAARDDVACSQRLGAELGVTASTIRVYRKRALDRVRDEMQRRGHRFSE